MKRYLLRLFALALISEIPFDLLLFSKPFCSEHQNVIWTLLASAAAVYCVRSRPDDRLLCFFAAAAAVLLAELCRFDYGGLGVLTVLLFCRIGREDRLRLSLGLVLISLTYAALYSAWLQLFAVLSLPLIFSYNGERGKDGTGVRLILYGFYPAHMLLLCMTC